MGRALRKRLQWLHPLFCGYRRLPPPFSRSMLRKAWLSTRARRLCGVAVACATWVLMV